MRRLRSPLLILALLPFAACMTWRRIPPSEVRPSNTLRVVTDSGREYRFSVTDVEPDALVGEDVRVEFDEILLVERRETDVDRTLANLGEAGLVVVAVVAFVVVTTALSVFHHERL